MTIEEKLEIALESLRFIEFSLRTSRKHFQPTPEEDAAEMVAHETLIQLGEDVINIAAFKPDEEK